MTRYLSALGLFSFALILAVMSAGCDPASTSTGSTEKGGQKSPSANMSEEDKEIAQELAKLPEADRKLAEEQKVCPVTDEPLGSMGKPMKLTVQGKEVFICCASCEDTIKKDPEKYLAKIGK